MKKLCSAMLLIATVALFTMCNSTSIEDEIEYTEATLGNEKISIDPNGIEDKLMDMVNEHRVSIGMNTLQDSPSSYKYAEEHNNYMIAKNKLSHDNFESRANKIAEETDAIGISENVARYYISAEKTMEAWLVSDSHKKALEGDYTHTTLSVQLDKEGRPYYTQIFIKVE
ncbi:MULTISPECIES: CAP domain-containing protein [Flavobacteriaceae]|uniref:CAP domain-containing protein n=1 Tax=Flavobacteriaceae TaxID=49546 RepID=UPI00234B3A90|nr:CAP domain-containing protein [Muricauda sp. SP22]MDC6362282.1 CAP domain-containing protein [Muricauda sp. SP22]